MADRPLHLSNDPQLYKYGGYNFPLQKGMESYDGPIDGIQPEPVPAAPPPAAPQVVDPKSMTAGQLANAGSGYKRQSAIKGGVRDTTGSLTQQVTTGRPNNPEYDQFRAENQAQKESIAGMRAEYDTQMLQQDEMNKRQAAADQQLQVQEAEAMATEAEAAARTSIQEMDAHLAQQKQMWLSGERPTGMFAGSDSGAVLGAIGVALAGLDGAGSQANAMNMVNSALERSMRAQEFQTNSMFKQLENKYGDRNQARAALKMQQLQYTQSMAEYYAAQNQSPAVAFNLAEFLNKSQAEYEAASDEFRAAEYGKRTETNTQNRKMVQGRSGGIVPLSLDEQLKMGRLKKQGQDYALGERDLAGVAEGSVPADWDKDRAAIGKLNNYEMAHDQITDLVNTMGGQMDQDGAYVKGSLAGGSGAGIGLGSGLPDAINPSEQSVKVGRKIKDLARSLVRAERGKISNEAERKAIETLTSKWDEGDAINGIENAIQRIEIGRAGARGTIRPENQKYFYSEGGPRDSARKELQRVSPADAGGRPDTF